MLWKIGTRRETVTLESQFEQTGTSGQQHIHKTRLTIAINPMQLNSDNAVLASNVRKE